MSMQNVSGSLRVFRIAVGVALAAYAVFAPTHFAPVWVLFALAGVALTTGLSGFCPLCLLAGWRIRYKADQARKARQ